MEKSPIFKKDEMFLKGKGSMNLEEKENGIGSKPFSNQPIVKEVATSISHASHLCGNIKSIQLNLVTDRSPLENLYKMNMGENSKVRIVLE
jgi:hypothetical protein